MKKSKKTTTLIILLVFLIGLSLLAYPTVSDQWNKIHQTRAIITHAENVAKLSAETCEKLFSEAKAFNASLPGMKNRWKLSKEDKKTYNSLLVSFFLQGSAED